MTHSRRRARGGAAVATVAALAACARVGALPGGPPDETGPLLLETVPEALAVGPVDGPVVFRFDERLSEQGVAGAVRVSPATGRVRVDRSGRELRVSLEGGWRPDQVYVVTVAPTLQDLFRNRRTARTELVFSTGPAIVETAVAGLITDRITGDEVPGALLRLLRPADSTAYLAVADSTGFAALRYVPFGDYAAVAFVDRDNDGVVDPLEAASAPAVVFLNEAQDTSVIVYDLLPGDTTPARLLRAEPLDSAAVRLSFDDHLDPGQDPGAVTVQLFALPDSTTVGRSVEVFHGGPFQARRQALEDSVRAAREDSLLRARVDSLAAIDPDSAAALLRADSVERARRAALSPAAAQMDSAEAPTQDLVFQVAPPLPAGERFLVRVSGARNLTNINGGGGEAAFTVPTPADTAAPAPPDTAASRSVAVARRVARALALLRGDARR